MAIARIPGVILISQFAIAFDSCPVSITVFARFPHSRWLCDGINCTIAFRAYKHELLVLGVRLPSGCSFCLWRRLVRFSVHLFVALGELADIFNRSWVHALRSIYSVGSLFVATVALPHEQSLAGGLFNTLTMVFASTYYMREANLNVLICTLYLRQSMPERSAHP